MNNINVQGKQHEYTFPHPGVDCPCRNNTNTNKKKCKKMVAIFYRFAHSNKLNLNKKWYTYVKLETTTTRKPKNLWKHVGHAILHHWFGKVKAQKPGMHVRRENLIQLPRNKFDGLNKIKPKNLKNDKKITILKSLGITKQNIYQYSGTDQKFYTDFQSKSNGNTNQLTKLRNYNKNVRRANEFYVTTELYRHIDPTGILEPIVFFTKFFTFLNQYGMCFESGSIVFEGQKMYHRLLPDSGVRAGAHILPAQSHSMINYTPWSKLPLNNNKNMNIIPL